MAATSRSTAPSSSTTPQSALLEELRVRGARHRRRHEPARLPATSCCSRRHAARRSRLKDERIHLAWLNTGGVQGHSSIAHAAAMLEMLGIPYIGHDPLTAAALDNKFFFKRQLMAMGIPTAPFIVWHPGARPMPIRSADRQLRTTFSELGRRLHRQAGHRPRLAARALRRARRPISPRSPREVFDITQQPRADRGLPARARILHRGVRARSIATQRPARAAAPARSRSPASSACSAPDERVFTSMDTKPDHAGPRAAARSACATPSRSTRSRIWPRALYIEFPLKTLVRLDVRADRNGKLFVLEANPKPDLKAPDGHRDKPDLRRPRPLRHELRRPHPLDLRQPRSRAARGRRQASPTASTISSIADSRAQGNTAVTDSKINRPAPRRCRDHVHGVRRLPRAAAVRRRTAR